MLATTFISTVDYFAWILGLREPKFVPGYSGTELDLALDAAERWMQERKRPPGSCTEILIGSKKGW